MDQHEEDQPTMTVWSACETGDVESLRHLLQTDPSCVNRVNPANGASPLHIATNEGQVTCMELLLSMPDIDAEKGVEWSESGDTLGGSQRGDTALFFAVTGRQSDDVKLRLCRLLTAHGASAATANYQMQTVFYWACHGAPRAVVEFLVDHDGAALTAQSDGWGDRHHLPHHFAVSANRVDNMALLITRSVASGETSFDNDLLMEWACIAASSGHMDALKFVLYNYRDQIMSCAQNRCKLLVSALGYDFLLDTNSDCVLFLLKQGFLPYAYDADGNVDLKPVVETCLHHDHVQMRYRPLEMVLFFVPKSVVADFNRSFARGDGAIADHPLHATIGAISGVDVLENRLLRGHLEMLLDHGFDPNVLAVASNACSDYVLNCMAGDRYGLTSNHRYRLLSTNLLLPNDNDDRRYHLNVVANAICHFELDEFNTNPPLPHRVQQYVAALRILLSYRANVNAVTNMELTPLVMLLWKDRRMFCGEESLMCLFDLLLVEGAYLNYRRADSVFRSPDVAMVAACMGNVAVLARMMKRCALSVDDLLHDLSTVDRRRGDGDGDGGGDGDGDGEWPAKARWTFRNLVGASVAALLTLTPRKDAELRRHCEAIDRRFRVPENPDNDRDVEWRKVYAELESVSLLKHISRLCILQYFTAIGTELSSTTVSVMLIPDAVKPYLLFDDVCNEQRDYDV